MSDGRPYLALQEFTKYSRIKRSELNYLFISKQAFRLTNRISKYSFAAITRLQSRVSNEYSTLSNTRSSIHSYYRIHFCYYFFFFRDDEVRGETCTHKNLNNINKKEQKASYQMKKRKRKLTVESQCINSGLQRLGQLDYVAEQSGGEPSRDTSGRRRFYPAHCRV